MARRTVFTDSGFWKYSWAHLVMSMTESCRWVMQCHLRAQRPRQSNKGLQHCPLRTDISPVSLNLLMMLCTIAYELCKALAIWRWGTLSLKYSTIFLHTLSQIREPMPSLLLRDSAFLRHPFYSNHVIDLMSQFDGRCSPSWILSNFLFFQPFVPHVPTFSKTCSRHQILNELNLVDKSVNFSV